MTAIQQGPAVELKRYSGLALEAQDIATRIAAAIASENLLATIAVW